MFNENWLNEYGFRKINSEAPSILSARSIQSTSIKEKERPAPPNDKNDKKKSLSRN